MWPSTRPSRGWARPVPRRAREVGALAGGNAAGTFTFWVLVRVGQAGVAKVRENLHACGRTGGGAARHMAPAERPPDLRSCGSSAADPGSSCGQKGQRDPPHGQGTPPTARSAGRGGGDCGKPWLGGGGGGGNPQKAWAQVSGFGQRKKGLRHSARLASLRATAPQRHRGGVPPQG
jgi:hypothetical protein